MYTHLQERYAERPPVNISVLNKMKAEGQKIACLTAYDASYAALVDEAGADLVLVGDSLGMVIQGHATTVPVTLEDVIYHCKAVSRGLYRPFLMADMPFMTYASREQALNNAVRLMQEGGAKMVKIHWNGKKHPDFPAATIPDSLHDLDTMVKDSRRFAATGGWGYGQFNYDAASDNFTPLGTGSGCGFACHTKAASVDYVFTRYPKR